MYYCQLCGSLYERRFYRTIGCGRGLHPNLNKENRNIRLIALWNWNVTGICFTYITSCCFSNKLLALMYNEVMNSQILLAYWAKFNLWYSDQILPYKQRQKYKINTIFLLFPQYHPLGPFIDQVHCKAMWYSFLIVFWQKSETQILSGTEMTFHH